MNPNKRSKHIVTFTAWISVQLVFSGAFVVAWFLLSGDQQREVIADISQKPYAGYRVEVGTRSDSGTALQ